MRAIVACFAAACLAVCAVPAHAQSKSLTLITGNDFKPYTDEALPGGGMITEIIRQVLEDRGYDVTVEFRDAWPEVYDTAASGEFDGTFPYYYRIRRARDFAYSEPIFSETQWAMSRRGRFEPKEFGDLRGRKACKPQGYALPPAMINDVKTGAIELEEPNTMTRCFELLALNRTDFVVSGQRQGLQLADAVPDFSRDEVATSPFVLVENKQHFIVSHETEAEKQILADFNEGLRLFKTDGRYNDIVSEYLPGWAEQPPGSEPSRAGVQATYQVTLPSGRKFKAKVAETDQGEFQITTRYGNVTLRHSEIQKFEEIADKTAAPVVQVSTVAATTTTDEDDAVGETAAPALVSVNGGASALQLSGVSAVGSALIPALARAFADDAGGRPGDWANATDGGRVLPIEGRDDNLTQVAYRTANAQSAVGALVAGETDIAVSDRPVSPAETRRALRANLGDLQSETAEKVIALRAGAVLVNPANQVGILTLQQIEAIFAGRIRNWATVGGAAGQIEVIVPAADTPTGQLFNAEVLNGLAAFAGATPAVNDRDVFAKVAASPRAIGFAPVGAGSTAKTVKIDKCGVLLAPTSFQVKVEEYPFVQRIYMYAPPRTANRYVGSFVSFAESDAGQEVIASRGFVDLRTTSQTQADFAAQLERLRRYTGDAASGVPGYLEVIDGATRVSKTFRFRTASSVLDPRALRDLRRAAAFLREQGDTARVVLVGFADARGDLASNYQLSIARAESVANALRAELPGVDIQTVTGFGESLPVACNDAEDGWQLNRRVEMWIRG